jgi:hypothetical protein
MAGPGLFRAHAEVREPLLQFTARRAIVGTVEVFDLTAQKQPPSCVFNPHGAGGGRQ